MCGIAGCITTQTNTVHENLIQKIVVDQHLRGPDHQHIEKITAAHGELLFGHNRLSIVDLTQHANQPMWDASERYCIVYNGEVYNYIELRQQLVTQGHHFRSQSDTEVILEAFKEWGIAAINQFNGPFAFAIFDKVEEQLWLVRDRFGVKPLYYCIENNTLYFASSTKTLADHFNCEPNLQYLSRGLKYLVYEDDTAITPYANIQAVPAAHYVTAKFNNSADLKIELKQYYDLHANVLNLQQQLIANNADQLLEAVAMKLTSAVQVRLRADVAIGVALSGGLDSSSVAAIVAQQQTNITGFTFGHPTAKKSEGPLVAKLANKLNCKVEYIWPSAVEVISALPQVLTAQNAPFPSLSIVAQFLVYQRVKQSGIKVLLGGQGGDEGFMGYRKFQLFYLQQLLQQKNYLAAIQFFLQLMPLLTSELSKAKLYWQHKNRYQNKKYSSVLCLPDSNRLQLGSNHDLLARQMHDVTQFSLPTLLRYEDRNSMANSVESRLPFMDYQLIELGLALPTVLKLNKGYGKWGLRQIMQHKIPDEIRLARYKRGFDVASQHWLTSGLGQLIRTALQDKQSYIKEFIMPGVSIAQVFSDRNLAERPNAMGEAMTLLWLGKGFT